MNVLITGGTGMVGKRLALAMPKSDRIFVFSREKRENHDNMYFIQTDLCNKDIKSIDGIDVVYHLAANMDENNSKMHEDNVESTKNIIELCMQAGVKQIVFMSSSGVLGETDKSASEDFLYNPETDYEKSKMECEQLIKDSGIPYTIIRASIIIAPNKIWQVIVGAARKGFPVIGSGENKFHLTYVNDAVSLLLLVKNNDKAINQIFNVATKDVPRYIDVYNMICDELKMPITKKHVSVFWIKFILFFKNISSKNAVINSATINRLVRNRELSIDKARSILGFEPRFNTHMALRETIKYLKLLRLGYSDDEIAEMSLVKR